METTVLKNGTKVDWEATIISSRGIEVLIHTKLDREEMKEFKYELRFERDVVKFRNSDIIS